VDTLKDVSAHDRIVMPDTVQHAFQRDAFHPDAFQRPLHYLNDWPKSEIDGGDAGAILRKSR
jgi:hypothetical protein